MSSTESPLMQMLGSQMRYLTKRQTVLAQNVANLDTPGYMAMDIKKPDFSKMAQAENQRLAMRTTSGKHLTGTLGLDSGYRAEKDDQYAEITPTANGVSLEDEMAKISDTNAQYEMSSALFKKFTTLYRTALGK